MPQAYFVACKIPQRKEYMEKYNMNYQEFVTCLLAELQELYGKDVVLTTEKIVKNNGQNYNGLQITMNASENIIPIINMDEIYEDYNKNNLCIKDCVKKICSLREKYAYTDDISLFACKVQDWKFAKENVYPILLSTEDNRILLQKLVCMPMLDLSVAYIIRGGEGKYAKVNKTMLNNYGIDIQELHGQAMKNIKKEEYRFEDINDLLKDMLCETECKKDTSSMKNPRQGEMYILTNKEKLYGAAGILDKKLIREFAGKRSFFILPSSIHELIFVPEDDGFSKEELDKMVSETNESIVPQEERLSDHSYYYDARADEIKIDV